jgi:hypothetical protein
VRPEEVFGVNAGKVWHALHENEQMSIAQLMKAAKLKRDEVMAALGWLGREGKIEIIKDKNKKTFLFKLLE